MFQKEMIIKWKYTLLTSVFLGLGFGAGFGAGRGGVLAGGLTSFFVLDWVFAGLWKKR
jgi:hypothetical protein